MVTVFDKALVALLTPIIIAALGAIAVSTGIPIPADPATAGMLATVIISLVTSAAVYIVPNKERLKNFPPVYHDPAIENLP